MRDQFDARVDIAVMVELRNDVDAASHIAESDYAAITNRGIRNTWLPVQNAGLPVHAYSV